MQLRCRRTNHPSALTNLSVVDERVDAELTAGQLLGPISPQLIPFVHTSPLGLVQKPHQPNKWRIICDLTPPPDHSVNDGILPDLCSLRYASMQDAVNVIQLLGKGTQLVKLDIKDTYRIVPVHPADYHLLGVAWRGNIYIDRALPFGLRSAPKIFSVLADFFAWVHGTRVEWVVRGWRRIGLGGAGARARGSRRCLRRAPGRSTSGVGGSPFR